MPVSRPSRRHFMRVGAALAGAAALPDNLRKALAVAPHHRKGTIEDIEHVVILMQENRSFDHYFGTLSGVRGYDDPRANILPDGNSVFHQPDGAHGFVLPFRMNTAHTSSACIASLDHSWKQSQTTWASWDCWVPHKTAMTMGHFTRADIPYYYALADAFTICDAYHASLFGPTNPNRLFLFTGTSGLAVGNSQPQAVDNVDDGNWTADISKDKPGYTPLTWSTYAENLQTAGVSWKIYQEYDNFGDNPLSQFAPFRNVHPGSWQYDRARAIVLGSTEANSHASDGAHLVAAFERDIVNKTLPQISWIVPPAALSEHPNAPPGYGEHLISALMDVFVRHPETWSKTVFILNYDENDGFFDHIPAPVPALTPKDGASTVSVAGENYHGVPVGLGPRVPAIIISPWTKGGWVNSEVFDHTSVLRFLEARFGVKAPHITPWRRSICGDLTSAFDFSQRDLTWHADLPDTRDYLPQTRRSCALPHPTIPVEQHMPRQEHGQRPTRPLGYRLSADMSGGHDTGLFHIRNAGSLGAVFRLQAGAMIRTYTIGAGHAADVTIPQDQTVTLDGPNGFCRMVSGRNLPDVSVSMKGNTLAVSIVNRRDMPIILSLVNAYSSQRPEHVTLAPSRTHTQTYDLLASNHWYDVACTIEGDTPAMIRVAGHCETGLPSLTDPLIGRDRHSQS